MNIKPRKEGRLLVNDQRGGIGIPFVFKLRDVVIREMVGETKIKCQFQKLSGKI